MASEPFVARVDSSEAEEMKRHIMDLLAGQIGPDVLIDHSDDGSFAWIDVEGQKLWRIVVQRAKFEVAQ